MDESFGARTFASEKLTTCKTTVNVEVFLKTNRAHLELVKVQDLSLDLAQVWAFDLLNFQFRFILLLGLLTKRRDRKSVVS